MEFKNLDDYTLTYWEIALKNTLKYELYYANYYRRDLRPPNKKDWITSIIEKLSSLDRRKIHTITLSDLQTRQLLESLRHHLIRYPHDDESNFVANDIVKIQNFLGIDKYQKAL